MRIVLQNTGRTKDDSRRTENISDLIYTVAPDFQWRGSEKMHKNLQSQKLGEKPAPVSFTALLIPPSLNLGTIFLHTKNRLSSIY